MSKPWTDKAALIRLRSPDILRDWENKYCLEEEGAPAEKEKIEFFLRGFIERLAIILEEGAPSAPHPAEAAKEAASGACSPYLLIRELVHLRNYAWKALNEESPLPLPCAELLQDAFDRTIAVLSGRAARDRAERAPSPSALLTDQGHVLEAIFQDPASALCLWRGENFLFERINPLFQAIFSGRRLIGEPLLVAVPEMEHSPSWQQLRQVYQGGERFDAQEVLISLRTGIGGEIKNHYFDYSLVRVNDERGAAHGVFCRALDVTERVLTRRRLEQRENQLSIVVERAPARIAYLDSQGRYLMANGEFERWLGLSAKELLGRAFAESLPSERRAALATRITEALAGQASEFEEAIHQRGETRFVKLSLTPDFDLRTGTPRGLVVTGLDITELKRKEQRLQDSHEYLAEFFRQAPVPIVILEGPRHRYTVANRPYEEMVGRSVLGREVYEVFDAHEVGAFVRLLDEVYQRGVSHTAKEMRLVLRDSDGRESEQFLNVNYHPFRSADGRIRGVIAIHQNVTEEVRARRLIEQSETCAREVANAMPQIVWTMSRDGKVNWFNDKYFEFTGHPRDSLWNDPQIYVHPDDCAIFAKKWDEARANRLPYEVEHRFRRAGDGQYRWYIARALPVRDSLGQVVRWICTSTDTHDQILLLKKLEEETRLRERFIAALTHDLRTPLTAAKLNAQILERRTQDPRSRYLTSRIVVNLDRTEVMIRDLLDAGRVRAGEPLPIKVEPQSLGEVLGPVEKSLKEVYGERVQFMGFDRPIEGYWDKVQVQRLVENLVSNAAKYGAADRAIDVRWEERDGCVAISVHNWGNPIPEKEQASLFELYQRSEAAQSGSQKGWGIGLTLVVAIAHAHGGRIECASCERLGTTFTLILPHDSRARELASA